MIIKYLRKYNAATTINFPLFKPDGSALEQSAVHAAGDTTIMQDEGVDTGNTGSGFVDEGKGYSIALTAGEMTAARVVIYVIDQTSPQVWTDAVLIIETYGNASAQHAFDLNTASTAQTGDSYAVVNHASYGNAQLVRATTPANALDVSATGEAGLDFNNIKDASAPKTLTNITVPVVTAVTNGVTVATNSDKTGYSIAGTKTTLDALNDITAASVWAVATRTITGGTIDTNSDKTGYRLSATGVDDVCDEVIEGTLTWRQITKICLSALAGESTGGGTATLIFRDNADTKARITATVDANGNRTAMTLDGA